LSDRILISRKEALNNSDQSKASFVFRNMADYPSHWRDNIIFLRSRKETSCTFATELFSLFQSFKKMINLMKISGLKEMERE